MADQKKVDPNQDLRDHVQELLKEFGDCVKREDYQTAEGRLKRLNDAFEHLKKVKGVETLSTDK